MIDEQRKIKFKAHAILPWATMALLLAIYHLIYRGFFPGPKGMGHDYSYVLPMMLDNYRWYLNNGWWSAPWFTPGFCGGQPAFPDPLSMYYSLPQLLNVFTNPLAAVYLNMLVFTAAGLVGMYLLLRRVFHCGPWTAVLGAGLYAFNGFFACRMLVGHVSFHGVMLVPWLALALLWSPDDRRHAGPAALGAGVLGGVLLAYWVNSGMLVMLPPSLIAVAGIMAIHGLTGGSWRGFSYRALLTGVVGAGLSLSKLSAVLALIDTFPRSDYLLPGMDSLWQTLRLAAVSLFLSPADVAQDARAHMANVQWSLDRHELEFGVTIAPVLIALIALAFWAWRSRHGTKLRFGMTPARIAWLTLLAAVLIVPLALNTYAPGWNAVLKELPIIKSASNLFRWFFIYIPLICVAVALMLERMPLPKAARTGLALWALAVALAQNMATDRQYYKDQPYQPATIVNAYYRESAARKPVPIRAVAVYSDQQGHVQAPLFRNDSMAQGFSQLLCYNPIFGYRLEHLPLKTLHPGPVGDVRDGRLNLKDPACYVFPTANACAPGDQFPVDRQRDAENFVHYLPYDFARPQFQIWADRTTETTLLALPLLLIGGLYWRFRLRKAK